MVMTAMSEGVDISAATRIFDHRHTTISRAQQATLSHPGHGSKSRTSQRLRTRFAAVTSAGRDMA